MTRRAVAAEDRSGYVHNIAPTEEREPDDFYPTPPVGTTALLNLETFNGPIWECACGDGAITRVLEAAGHQAVSTDLVDRGFGTPRVDFLLESRLLAPNIITNPPFKLAEAFLHHAFAIGAEKVALMLRLAWLEGEGRKRRVYDPLPPARVHVSSRRLTMLRSGTDGGKGGGGMIAFAWFVWERGHQGDTVLRWHDWLDWAPPEIKEKLAVADDADAMPLFK